MTLLVNFVSMSVHLRSAKEGPSTMRRTCICRGNEQQSLLLPRASCSCSSHAEDEYAASRAAKAGSCLVPALVSLSVQNLPTESFIGPKGINLTKSPSNSVGARVVEWGREGLDGRPRPVPCAHLWRNALTPPPPGDHQGPLHLRPTALAPTDHPASCLASRLRLMPITADYEV